MDPVNDAPDGDAELVLRLEAAGYAGPLQDAFDIMLVTQALAPLRRWQYDGSIFGRCQTEGRGITPHGDDREILRRDAAERIQLADETVAVALILFKRYALRDKGWRPEGGRSLRTYFVSTCLREYPAVFRRWSGNRKRQPPSGGYGLEPPDDGGESFRCVAADPAQVVESRLGLAALLADLPDSFRPIAELLAAGYTQVEAARRLGLSVRTVEDRIRRFRKTHRRPR